MDSGTHDRVEISDYPGTPTPPLATPAPQRGIKQVEGEASNQLDPALPPDTIRFADNKLMLTKNKWYSLLDKYAFSLYALVGIFIFYQRMRDAAFNGGQTAEFPEIVNTLFSRPSFELVTYSILFALSLTVTAFYVWQAAKFLRGPANYLVFDRNARTVTDSGNPSATPTQFSNISAINLDKQGSSWRVALALSAGKVVELGKWNKEAKAAAVANTIATYLSVPLERTQSPMTQAQGCIIALALVVVGVVGWGLIYWISTLFR